MVDIKPWYLSRTIWASVVGIVLAAGNWLGIATGGIDAGQLADSLLELAAAIAGAVAISGRLRANTRIG